MVKPQSRSYSSPLKSYEPILLRIDAPVEEVKDVSDPDRTNLVIRFTVLSAPWGQMDPPHKERQRHGNTVNAKSDGTPSLLAQLLNAASPHDLSKAEMQDTEIDQYLPGKIVEAIGRIKEDDKGRFWNVIEYRRPSGAVIAPQAQTVAPPADDYQLTPDGKFRWKAGMAAWEPVPEAPPPPAPAAAPPPPAEPVAAPPPVPTAAPNSTPPPAPAPGIRF